MDALSGGHKPQIAHAALTYVYYWYNFMPLARGTAVTGYITLLAIFLAADMPITSFIPKVLILFTCITLALFNVNVNTALLGHRFPRCSHSLVDARFGGGQL